VPFLNKAEDETALAAARHIARLLLIHPQVDSVLIGAAQAADPVREVWNRVGAVVLAAGEASRFGSLKQVLLWQGVPLVAHVTEQALACPDVDRVVVTVGAEAGRVRAALAGVGAGLVPALVRVQNPPLRVVDVPDWAEGQSRSVQAGLHTLITHDSASSLLQQASTPLSPTIHRRGETHFAELGAVLFLLADQPGISPELLSALIRRHRETLAPVVAPRYRGQRGNPVLFDRATFSEFARLAGDIGARPIIQAHADEVAWVDWSMPEIMWDIDTVADYRLE
jgi:molybdenum cofactor cytidylyltransferase